MYKHIKKTDPTTIELDSLSESGYETFHINHTKNIWWFRKHANEPWKERAIVVLKDLREKLQESELSEHKHSLIEMNLRRLTSTLGIRSGDLDE